MGKIKVLLVGSAFSADLHMDGYARFKDKIEITAICSKNIEQIHELAAKYGFTGYTVYEDYQQAIQQENCDVVDICLPNFLHCEVALEALEHGRHVICEKPLATTVEDAKKMVNKAKQAGRHIYYAEDWLFAPAIKKAVALVDEGAIGEVMYMRARECHSGSHSPFVQTLAFCGGGAMVHLGIHSVAFALSVKNNQWTELIAMTSGGKENNMQHKNLEGEDWAVCIIRFADGSTATLEANYITKGGMEDFIDFYGEKGCLHVDLNFTSAVSCFSLPGVSYAIEKAELTTGWTKPAVDEKYNLGYVGEIGHFIECIQEDKAAAIGLRGEDGLIALEVVQYIYQSAREGKKISNPKSGEWT